MTFSFTQQGLEKVSESPDRVDAAKKTVQSLGGQVRAFYAVAGAPFDTMFIVDAPDEQEAARMALAVATRGKRPDVHPPSLLGGGVAGDCLRPAAVRLSAGIPCLLAR